MRLELIKANVVADVKPIHLNKRYLFQNQIYYLDKIYFRFASFLSTLFITGYQISLKV